MSFRYPRPPSDRQPGIEESYRRGILRSTPYADYVRRMKTGGDAARFSKDEIARAATIPDSQPTRTPRTPTELTPRNYNPPRFQNEPQKVSGTPNPKFDRPVVMATASKKRDEDWYTPGS